VSGEQVLNKDLVKGRSRSTDYYGAAGDITGLGFSVRRDLQQVSF
jgi:hypothetical protein